MIATVDEARLHSEESEDVLVKLVGPVEVTGGESHFDLPAATCDRKMGLSLGLNNEVFNPTFKCLH